MSTTLLPYLPPTETLFPSIAAGPAALRLVRAVQALSPARNLDSVVAIVRRAARDVLPSMVAPDDCKKIFDIFRRVNPDRDGKDTGLSMVKKALERMGGYGDVQSELGQGTSFGLEFKSAEA